MALDDLKSNTPNILHSRERYKGENVISGWRNDSAFPGLEIIESEADFRLSGTTGVINVMDRQHG